MIIEPSDSASEKLRKASDGFLRQLSKHSKRRKEMKQAFAFRHGDQWDSDAKRVLEDEGRPCLTFNLIAPVMRELIGANQDQRREAKAAPVGSEDLPTAETINHLWQREYQALDVADVEDQVFDSMITCGVGFSFIDAHPDYDDPSRVCLTIESVSPFEILYDLESRSTNLRDCGEFWWARWFTESDFKLKYPEHADKFAKLVETHGESPMSDEQTESLMYGRQPGEIFRDSRFYDDKDKRVRVVRLFYKVPVKKYFAYDPRSDTQTGQPIGMQQVKRESYLALKQMAQNPLGPDNPVRIETYSAMGCEWRWFEFTGLQVLFDDKQPLDLGGECQLRAATCYFDDVQRFHYGMVRDLQDPQSEFNKRYSQELDHVNKQINPGVLADRGALGEDRNAAERKLRSGGLIEKTPGSDVQPIVPPQIPAAAETLAQRAQGLVSVISGVDTNPMLGGQPEQVAVGTALLSHRKGLLSISVILTNFRAYQKGQLSCSVRVILTTYPDEQIEAMLGDSQKLQVQNGVVVNAETGAQVPLRDLRAIKWNIEMDAAASNTTQQLLTLNMYQSLQASGVAIDPEVIFGAVPVSRDDRQKLIAYHRAQSQAAAQAQAQQAAAAQQQVDQVLQIETGRIVQKQAEAQLDNQTELTKAQIQLAALVAKLVVEATQKARESSQDAVDSALEHGMEVAEHEVKTAKTAADISIARRAQRAAERQPTAAA